MTEEQLFEDFLDFIKKQLRYGSSKAPRLDALLSEYTSSKEDQEKLTRGLRNIGALISTTGFDTINMQKIGASSQ